MAFDYGSIDLGLKNPFKHEGRVITVRGAIQTLVGLALLFIAASQVKSDPVRGWVLLVAGALLLVTGIKALSSGIVSLMRFFVGRNHPTSLAQNFSKSESSTAAIEKAYVAYDASKLEEMLMGRKNLTFEEPEGMLARFLHSIFPKLLYMPFPIRNKAQKLFGAWTSSLTVLLSYLIVAFICLNGFAGQIGKDLFPIYSVLALVSLLFVWHSAGRATTRRAQISVENLGGRSIANIMILSMVLPLLLGLAVTYGLDFFFKEADLDSMKDSISIASILLNGFNDFNPFLYIISIILFGAICSFIVVILLRQRTAAANPVTEVSELRDNWQESVHPKEIFINLDNLVMANRRYKEVPNRVYRELEPNLMNEVDGKGSFAGELIQEVQPTVRSMDMSNGFKLFRSLGLYASNLLYVLAIGLVVWFAYSLIEAINFFLPESVAAMEKSLSVTKGQEAKLSLIAQHSADGSALIMMLIHLALIWFIVKTFAEFLGNTAHLFFAEMQFESLLVYFKCEGTFTESKISTGTAMHDSTRSENVLVRSSITPWVIVTKTVTSTFAASGMRNLEYPRHILEMHKSEEDMHAIREDIINFLKDRESIASITSNRDLENASNIHSINSQSRVNPMLEKSQAEKDEAAAYSKLEQNGAAGDESSDKS